MRSAFLELLKFSLPADLGLAELSSNVPQELWQTRPRLAAIYALRQCSRINWQAYLERNPGLRSAGADPYLHFIQDGIYERKKLVSWHPLKMQTPDNAPLISIIIINYNQELYLAKCIESVLGQTLKNLQIIIVDDKSTDSSLAIMRRFQERDARVSIVAKEANGGLFAARKTGLSYASGLYVMFLDSDDFLCPNACEVAYKAIAKGYDLVAFGANIINMSDNDPSFIQSLFQYLNPSGPKETTHHGFLMALFHEKSLPWTMWGKIYLREICLFAYQSINIDARMTLSEDYLAMTSIADLVRSAFILPDRLINYRLGAGTSTLEDSAFQYKTHLEVIKYYPAIVEHVQEKQLDANIDEKVANFIKMTFAKLLTSLSSVQFDKLFQGLVKSFGVLKVLDALIDKDRLDFAILARKLLAMPLEHRQSQKRIAIYISLITIRTLPGLASLAKALGNEPGCELTIIADEAPDVDLAMPAGTRAVYIGGHGTSKNNLKQHCKNLNEVLAQNKFAVIFYFSTYGTKMLFDFLLLKQYAVAIILLDRGSFAMPFAKYNSICYNSLYALYACCDAVACETVATALYLRANGVNAWHVPTLVAPAATLPKALPRPGHMLVAIAYNPGNPYSQIGETFLVVTSLLKKKPDLKVFFLTEFSSERQKRTFYAKLSALGLTQSIVYAEERRVQEELLAGSMALLSTAYLIFDFASIKLAQSLGIPCVLYDVPLDYDPANESLILVPQGDSEAVSNSILQLCSDFNRWNELSLLARKYSALSARGSQDAIAVLAQNFYSYTPLITHAKSLYRQIIKYASFYANNKEKK